MVWAEGLKEKIFCLGLFSEHKQLYQACQALCDVKYWPLFVSHD